MKSDVLNILTFKGFIKCSLFFLLSLVSLQEISFGINDEATISFDISDPNIKEVVSGANFILDGVSPSCPAKNKSGVNSGKLNLIFKTPSSNFIQALAEESLLRDLKTGDTLQIIEVTSFSNEINASFKVIESSDAQENSIAQGDEYTKYVAFVIASYNEDTPEISDQQLREIFYSDSKSVSKFFAANGDPESRLYLRGRTNEDGDIFRVNLSHDVSEGRNCEDAFSDIWHQAIFDTGLSELTTNYDHVVVIRNAPSGCSLAGKAVFNSIQSVIFANPYWDQHAYRKLIAHEIGHNLNLAHAGELVCPSGGADCVPSGDFTKLRFCENVDFGPCRREYHSLETMGYSYDFLSGSRQEKLNSKGAVKTQANVTGTYLLDDIYSSEISDRRYVSLILFGDEYHLEFRGFDQWDDNPETKEQIILQRYFPIDLHDWIPRSAILNVGSKIENIGLEEGEKYYLQNHRTLLKFEEREGFEIQTVKLKVIKYDEFDDTCWEKPSINITPSHQESSWSLPPTFRITITNNNPLHCTETAFKVNFELSGTMSNFYSTSLTVSVPSQKSESTELVVAPQTFLLFGFPENGKLNLTAKATATYELEAEPGRDVLADSEKVSVSFSPCGAAPKLEISPEKLVTIPDGVLLFTLGITDINSTFHCKIGNPVDLSTTLPDGWSINLPNQIWLEVGESLSFPLEIKIPTNATSGEYPFVIAAASAFSGFKQTESALIGINGLGNDNRCDRKPIVTVVPGLQGGKEGSELTYVVQIRNANQWFCGIIPYSLNDSKPQGFTSNFSTYSMQIPSGESDNVLYRLTSSPFQDPGLYDFTVSAKAQNEANGLSSSYTGYYEVTGDECNKYPDIFLEPAVKNGAPGNSVSYTINIVNRNGRECGLTLYSSQLSIPSGWNSVLYPSAFTLSGGSRISLKFDVTSTLAAIPGDYIVGGTIRYQQKNDSLLRGEREFEGIYRIGDGEESEDECHVSPSLVLSPALQEGDPGATKSYLVNVKSNAPSHCKESHFTLFSRISPPLGNWSTSFAEQNIKLAPGESLDTSLSVTSPLEAAPGDYVLVVETVGDKGVVNDLGIYRIKGRKKSKFPLNSQVIDDGIGNGGS